MKSILTTSVFVIALGSHARAAEELHDIQGVRLGVPLTEFQQLHSPGASESGSPSVIVSSNDSEAIPVCGFTPISQNL